MAWFAEATTVFKATDPTECDCQRNHERKPVAGRFVVADHFFGNLNSGISTEQCPGDRFSIAKLPPKIGLPDVSPTLSEKVDQFCADQGRNNSPDKNPEERRITVTPPVVPEDRSDQDSEDRNPSVDTRIRHRLYLRIGTPSPHH